MLRLVKIITIKLYIINHIFAPLMNMHYKNGKLC